MTDHDVDPSGDREIEPSAPVLDATPRVPRVHVPYLIGLGVFALASAALIYVEIPEAGSLMEWAQSALLVAVLVLHVSWLSALFKAAELFLGDASPMPRQRVVAVTWISCLLMPVWSSWAFMVLLRGTANAIEDRGAGRSPQSLIRGADDAPALIFAGLVWVAFETVLLARLAPLAGSHGRPSDALGEFGSYMVSAMHLACTGYWMWFTARTVPALYRGFAVLNAEKDRPTFE